LSGGFGNDIMVGGTGNDTLSGDNGNDIYMLNLGDGIDEIRDYSTVYNEIDKIVFGVGITKNNLQVTWDQFYMKLKYSATDSVKVGLSSLNTSYSIGVEKFEFADGSSLDMPALRNINVNAIGTANTDTLYGMYGNDTLNGGSGNDMLSGGAENDTYKFTIGDGKDVVYDYSGTDTISFDNTVSKSNIAFYLQNNNNLTVQYSVNDSINVSLWKNTENKIEKIQLSDGNYLSSTDVDKLIQSMTAYSIDKGIAISNVNDVSKNAELMTMINNTWHRSA